MTTTDAVPPPIEQLAQQQVGPVPVAFSRVSETLVTTDRGIRMHLLAVGADGSLWERWSDETPGTWAEVPRPTR